MNINKIRKNILLIPVLYVTSIFYRFLTDIRNLLYNTGIIELHKFNVPIISVGNISAGGTGKTPFIIYLIEKLSRSYKKIVIVSRGYGRISKGLIIVSDGKGNIIDANIGGDEPVLIAGKFPGIPIIVSEDRKKGIQLAIDQFNPDLILLDDAFQHRKVNRICDIVLVNANCPVNKDKLLPFGNLRERADNLNRADFILITKINNFESIANQVNYYKKYKADLYLSKFVISGIKQINSKSEISTIDLREYSFIAFSGIAEPESFRISLEKLGVNVEKFISFKDHKKYNKSDINYLLNIAKSHKCKYIITTEKDLVKLNLKEFDNYNLIVLEMRVDVINEEIFLKKVQDCIDSK
jgi:tetraacyldisaccharide 4'-kinase